MGCFENWEKASLLRKMQCAHTLAVGCLNAAEVWQKGLLTILICTGPEVSHHVGLRVFKAWKALSKSR